MFAYIINSDGTIKEKIYNAVDGIENAIYSDTDYNGLTTKYINNQFVVEEYQQVIPPQPEPIVYTPSLSETKLSKMSSISIRRDEEERKPLEYLGKLFDFDRVSSERLSWAIDAARSAVALNQEFSVDWTCNDNSIITLSAQDILGLPIAVALRTDAIHKKARLLKEEVEKAATVEDVNKIEWI